MTFSPPALILLGSLSHRLLQLNILQQSDPPLTAVTGLLTSLMNTVVFLNLNLPPLSMQMAEHPAFYSNQ